MSGKRRLLIVDDEEEILEFLVRVFRDFESKTALSAESALDILQHERFDVLVTDIRMPGAGGLSLIDSAKRIWPDLPIVVITGNYQEMPPAVKDKVHHWIVKPFTVETIRKAVAGALGA